jgi:DNA-binding transcriptional MocR family regulator
VDQSARTPGTSAEPDLSWWVQAVFGPWRERRGPRYERLATALVDAVEQDLVEPGARLPAERLLADALGVSRGTVVACLDRLTEAGVVRRVQGAGTFVAGRPGWAAGRSADAGAVGLRRRLAAGLETIDLARCVPAGVDHLPPLDWSRLTGETVGHGTDRRGIWLLRQRIAEHLTNRRGLPTVADQVLVVNGERAALELVLRTFTERATLVVGCPHDPDLGVHPEMPVATVPVDGAGLVPDALRRVLRRVGPASVLVAPDGHRPTGVVMPSARREAVVDATTRAGAVLIEDQRDADLVLDPDDRRSAPLAASSQEAIVLGSASSLLWAGFRVAWIRADGSALAALQARLPHVSEPPAIPAQLAVAALLDTIDDPWFTALRATLVERRDLLVRLIADRLPAFVVHPPAAGLSVWVDVPVVSADAFVHVASQHGVEVVGGTSMCRDGQHLGCVRLSFAEPLETLTLAVERLASAWVAHSEALATAPRSA